MKAGGVHVWPAQGKAGGQWKEAKRTLGLMSPQGPEDLPASERSLRELLSAPRLSPSPAPYVSSRLLRTSVPFTESLAPPGCEVLGRIIPFCFSSSAGWQ